MWRPSSLAHRERVQPTVIGRQGRIDSWSFPYHPPIATAIIIPLLVASDSADGRSRQGNHSFTHLNHHSLCTLFEGKVVSIE
jgi:hypothetical protein